MSENADADSSGMTPRRDAYTTIVRLVAGGIGEGIDRLLAMSNELDDADVAPRGELVGPIHADPTLMAAVGWVSELPQTITAVGTTSYRMAYPAIRVAGVAVDTAAYLASITGVSSFLAGVTEPARTAFAQERLRLSDVGTAEYARGRVLAVSAFESSVNGIVGLLSESEELGDLVREQTLGITGSAIQEIRETGAAADRLTEGIFRRIGRRPARQLPPRPAIDS
ncbi:MAG TPA: hypothetical protein VLA29_12840 [Acidimicrobiia bacterium]|nr:hypothetical protein [Acidimicrobiia bacterium]